MDTENKLKLTQEDVAKIINGIEAEFPVDKWVIDGIHVWPIIRVYLFLNISSAYVIDPQPYFKGKYLIITISQALKSLSSFFRFIFAYLLDCGNNFQSGKRDVIFLSDGESFNRINGHWFDRFCDPLIDYFRKNNISSFSMVPYGNYFVPRYNPSKFVQPHIDLRIFISRVIWRRIRAKDEELSGFAQFCKFLEASYPDIVRITLNIIRKRVSHIRILASYFKKIMLKTRPKMGFVVGYYGIEGFAFNLACRESGIPAVDIQHGYQGDLHLAYNRWHKVPDAGYELLPSFFWCWSDFEVNAIKRCAGRFSYFHKPIAGSNLWLNQCLSGNSALVKDCDEVIIKFKESHKHANHILFTQSIGIDNEYFKNILQAIKNSPDAWFWWIRIHPGEFKIKPKLIKVLHENRISNYNIDYATVLPLYVLLRHMDVHITTLSATVLEAERFGVPSVVTHPVGSEFFCNQVSPEFLLSAYTPGDILQAVRSQIGKDFSKKTEGRNNEQYFDVLNFLAGSIKAKNMKTGERKSNGNAGPYGCHS